MTHRTLQELEEGLAAVHESPADRGVLDLIVRRPRVDLSQNNLPPGTRLSIGSAIIEINARPHTGCKKFATRYGLDALRFVKSSNGRRLRLRGVNARVAQSGRIRVGDVATVMATPTQNEV